MVELNSFICADCMDYLPQFPDKYFELAIVDVPYGIGEDGSKNHTRTKLAKSKDYKGYTGGDLSAPDKKYFDELMRVSKKPDYMGRKSFYK